MPLPPGRVLKKGVKICCSSLSGTTLVVVTHSPAHAAQASRVLRLLDGRVLVEAMG